MYRYLALAWNTKSPDCTAYAAHLSKSFQEKSPIWSRIFHHPGLMVFHEAGNPKSMQAYSLGKNGGVILGRLFTRAQDDMSSSAKSTIKNQEAQQIIESQGQYLLENFWGRYVAFMYQTQDNNLQVLRDPTGGLPCFVTRHRGVDIIFSHMADCTRLGLAPYTVNWAYLAAYLKFPLLQRRKCGLNEVSELLPGEALHMNNGRRSRHILWDPGKIAADHNIEDPMEAARLLRQTTKDCVSAWASGYQNILHLLSGGLDSSIVLSQLRHMAPAPKITCLNYYTPTPDGDERAYARLAAGQSPYQIIEKEISAATLDFGQLSGLALSAKPADYLYQLEHSQYEAKLAQDVGAEAIFTGAGGDGIFFQPRTGLGAVDFAKSHGLSPQLLPIALESARLQNTSLWSVLGAVVKYGLLNVRWSPYDGLTSTSPFLNNERQNSITLDDLTHPWLTDAAHIPNGKRLHMLALSAPPTFYDPLGQVDLPEQVYPLISQPLIELCLKIPTWILTTEGVDRGLARNAFQYDIPQKILTRHSKGGINDHYKTIVETHIGFIRDYLLDGLLIRQDLLNRERLENTLTGGEAPTGRNHLDIMTLVSLEAWVRSWHDVTPGSKRNK
tara:strand:+ start:1289 stop:3124 length:1836 start_codon:yes stop_codon:yes gene_type:complete